MSERPKNDMIDKNKGNLKEAIMKENSHKDKINKKKITSKQVVAMAGVVLLILMYVVTLVVAIVDSSASGMYFALCLGCTFVIPIVIWFYSWMYGRMTGKKVLGDPEQITLDELDGEE